MTADDNKRLVRRYKLEILNERRLDALAEIAADDYLDHAAFPGQPSGLAGFRYRLELLLEALDPRWTIVDLVAEGDRVAVSWVLDGVHRKRFLGLAATGRRVALHGIDMYRVHDGKFAEHWNVVDLLPLVAPTVRSNP